MINYNEIQKKTKVANAIIDKEKSMLEEFLLLQNNLKDTVKLYSEEISNNFSDNEVFKNMLISSIEAASLQISINIHDLENLINILEIISTRADTLEDDVEQYNLLFSKIEKNVTFVNEIMQRTKNSIEELSSIKSSKTEKTKVKSTPKSNEVSDESIQTIPRDIKKISDNKSSDLLCFFPKTANDILAISTIQDSYDVSFAEEAVTVSIEEENFNFTLKAVGIQVSNTSNVLLISRKANGFFVITNMVIDVPDFIKISKITRNKTLLEFEIANSTLNISVAENKLTFLETPNCKPAKILEFNNEETEEDFEELDESEESEDIEEIEETETISTISNNNLIQEIYKNNNTKNTTPKNDKKASKNTDKDADKKEKSSSSKTTQDNVINDSTDLLKDNDTLIISEKDNKVILPYTVEEVEKLYEKNKKKYSSVQDLIKNEYIISTDNFKNPIKSRFREAYQLIKKREHGHLKEAVDLGLELMFQSNLNPAIIAACKSLKELDVYLDCLDDNELDKFSCFNIVYNIPPSKKK